MSRWPTVPQEHWERASKMRREPTRAEQLLWYALRTHLRDFSFRRQHPIGMYIIDFVCLKAKLVVEIDGDVHALPNQKEHDAVRDDHLRSRGFRIVRYANDSVVKNLDGVLLDIKRLLGP